MPVDAASAKRYARKSPFLEWCEKDELSVIGGYGVDDLTTAPLKFWERLAGPAAYCHFEGSRGFVGVIVAEKPAGKTLKPITTSKEPARHLALRRSKDCSGRESSLPPGYSFRNGRVAGPTEMNLLQKLKQKVHLVPISHLYSLPAT